MAENLLLPSQHADLNYENRHNNLNQSFGSTKLIESKSYPYERLKQLNSNELLKIQNGLHQDMFKGHLV